MKLSFSIPFVFFFKALLTSHEVTIFIIIIIIAICLERLCQQHRYLVALPNGGNNCYIPCGSPLRGFTKSPRNNSICAGHLSYPPRRVKKDLMAYFNRVRRVYFANFENKTVLCATLSFVLWHKCPLLYVDFISHF